MKSGSQGEYVKCPYCGEQFWTRRSDKQFCSETHRKMHWKEENKGRIEETDFGRVVSYDLSSDQPAPQVKDKPKKDDAVERYGEWKARGRKCEVCGFHGSKELGIRVSAHHIIPRDAGGKADPDNLVDLCDPCHDWAELFASEARSRAEFFKSVNLNYPWPDMSIPKYDPDKVQCRLHGDFRKWVYGGMPPPPWGCTCKKSKSASTAEKNTKQELGISGFVPANAAGEPGTSSDE